MAAHDGVRRVAGAKLNLALHVRHRTAAGWHHLESLFVHTVDGDVVNASPADALTLTVTGPEAAGLSAGDDNLVLRAARALRERARIDGGAAITLDKRLPVASGIGGGSSDAAATLLALSALWGIAPGAVDLGAIAATLGADVAPCLDPRPKRVEGRGEHHRPVDAADLSGRPVLLVNPRAPVATADVFAAWDGIDRGALTDEPTVAALRSARNDLLAPAVSLAPAIGAVLALLDAAPSARLVRMSGSGATCFALFDTATARDAAQAAVARERPDWWLMATAIA